MSVYKTGRSADYLGAESKPPKRVYQPRKVDITTEAIQQFERMSRGLVPVCADGSAVAWAVDDTITPEQREWCWQTARQIRREAELAAVKRRALEPTRRTTSDIETAVASVLARWPDASAHDVRMTTGLETPRIVRTEAWLMAQMGKVKA